MRSFAHWNPRYIVNRSLALIDHELWPEDPWLTRKAIGLLDQLLRGTDAAIEFGAGRSTLWFAPRVKQLISIEDSAEWYKRVGDMISEQGIRNVDLRYSQHDYSESEGAISEYIRVFEEFPDQSVDFILIDGNYRNYCAIRSVPKVKSGGMIAIDNVNWFLPSNSHSPASRTIANGPADAIWQQFAELTAEWRSIWTSSGVWDTLILFKP